MNPEKPRSENIKSGAEQQAKIAKTEQKIPYETWVSAIDYVNALRKKLQTAHEEKGEQELDEGVENILIALKGHGFESEYSCSGHIQDKQTSDFLDGKPHLPYIQLNSTNDAAINKHTCTHLSQLLEKFYTNRPNVPIKDRIVLKAFNTRFYDGDEDWRNIKNDWENTRVSLKFNPTIWEKNQYDYSVEEINAKIAMCQKEINDFAEFLKSF